MKIKLTDRQLKLRDSFRRNLLKKWRQYNRCMYAVCEDIAIDLDFQIGQKASYAIREELDEIPSIRLGPYSLKTNVNAWLAKHYPVVSQAMFDGKTDVECLKIWSTQKYLLSNGRTCKRSAADLVEMDKDRRNNRKLRAIGELKNNLGDRWGRTDWHKCK